MVTQKRDIIIYEFHPRVLHVDLALCELLHIIILGKE
jgi:hypothetical protein